MRFGSFGDGEDGGDGCIVSPLVVRIAAAPVLMAVSQAGYCRAGRMDVRNCINPEPGLCPGEAVYGCGCSAVEGEHPHRIRLPTGVCACEV